MIGACTLLGMPVVISPDLPRYTLPAELLPGVPWPPGFRDEINAWSLDYLGTVCLLQDGEGIVATVPRLHTFFGDDKKQIIMNERTFNQMATQLRWKR